MRNYIAHYFNHDDSIAKSCRLSASNRIEAIARFEELHPNGMLISLKQIIK